MLFIRNFLLLLILNHSQLRTLLNNQSNCTNDIWQLRWSERIIRFQKTGKRYIDMIFFFFFRAWSPHQHSLSLLWKKPFICLFVVYGRKYRFEMTQRWVNDLVWSLIHGGHHVKITWLAELCLLYVGNIISKQIYEMSSTSLLRSKAMHV